MSEEVEGFIPWIEKYRPTKLAQVVGHKPIIARFESYVRTKNMPHLLLCGPAGVGKTTAVLAMARELYGEDLRQPLWCDYCSRKICRACVKSSARESKIKRNVICKDCWGNIPKRRKYKSA